MVPANPWGFISWSWISIMYCGPGDPKSSQFRTFKKKMALLVRTLKVYSIFTQDVGELPCPESHCRCLELRIQLPQSSSSILPWQPVDWDHRLERRWGMQCFTMCSDNVWQCLTVFTCVYPYPFIIFYPICSDHGWIMKIYRWAVFKIPLA